MDRIGYDQRHAHLYVREDTVGMYYLKCRHPELADRPETFATWRRRTLSDASARRELWRDAVKMSDKRLAAQVRTYRYLTTDPNAMIVRSARMFVIDRWYLRMYLSEQRRRERVRAVSGRVSRTAEKSIITER